MLSNEPEDGCGKELGTERDEIQNWLKDIGCSAFGAAFAQVCPSCGL